MKLLCLIALSLGVLATTHAHSESERHWKKIDQATQSKASVYVDTNSLKRSQGKGFDYGIGDILFVFDDFYEIDTGKKKYAIKSVIKSVVVDCKDPTITQVGDYYFLIPQPTAKDEPMVYKEYQIDQNNVKPINKHSFGFAVLCPFYI